MEYNLKNIVYYFECIDGSSDQTVCNKTTLKEAVELFKKCLEEDVKQEKFCDITSLEGKVFVTNKRSKLEIENFILIMEGLSHLDRIIQSYFIHLIENGYISINFTEKETFANITKESEGNYKLSTFSNLYSETPIETVDLKKEELYSVLKHLLTI
ncbi:hypothetical protein [Cetobacterium sp.]|uniref:hypothetical protein n=1 Tax=Cetobacterium sp. TaxID=2071632 RepID=UPI003F37E7A2